MNEKQVIVAAIRTPSGLVNELGQEVTGTWNAILNVGKLDGVREGQDFIIFTLGEEILDPANGQSLGRYEIVRGRGEVVHLQERLCTVRSLETKKTTAPTVNALALGRQETRTVEAPFARVSVGDLARRV